MLKLTDITKKYVIGEQAINAVDGISLSFPKNGFVSIVGQSGCGKTTLLNIIGGLDNPTSGSLEISGVNTSQFKSNDFDNYRNKNVGFVFQSYNLIHHLNIYQNVEMSLLLSGMSKKERHAKILKVLNKVGLKNQIYKKPNELSGGQMQRVAIARAIVNAPTIILADEPTGALDSKTSIQIMNILKELSQDFLVILVTHNEELAKIYSTRIIRLSDGKVVNDDIKNVKTEQEHKSIVSEKKSKMKVFTALKLSFKNLMTKKIRSFLIMIACSVGIVGSCLTISITNGMSNYTDQMQKNVLATNPIRIYSELNDALPPKENINYPEYPNDQKINITNLYSSYYGHINSFTNEYLDHIEKMDSNIYTIYELNNAVQMNIITKYNHAFERLWVDSSNIKELNTNMDYIEGEYEVLAGGKMPTEYNELALVIDKNNCIDISVLENLRIDYKDIESYSFNEIMKKEYRVILNNDYYSFDSNNERYYSKSRQDYEQLYNSSEISLKITSIIRVKETASLKIYNTGILYTKALSKLMMENNLESQIVKDQIYYGLDKDVFYGRPFEDYVTETQSVKKDYYYESRCKEIGAVMIVTSISIYTDTFEKRELVSKYLEEYNVGKDELRQIYVSDYMSDTNKEFALYIAMLKGILLTFSLIALFVSAIMISIITYISVIERTKEIGILRSIGARKKDVTIIFMAETSIIGFIAGLTGVISGIVLARPITSTIAKMLRDNNVTRFEIDSIVNPAIDVMQLLMLVVGSILISVLAGLIPALFASSITPIKALRKET